MMNNCIPKHFPVTPIGPNDPAKSRATCGTCGLSWDDGISTSWTPVPSGRCPFEYFHSDILKAKQQPPKKLKRGEEGDEYQIHYCRLDNEHMVIYYSLDGKVTGWSVQELVPNFGWCVLNVGPDEEEFWCKEAADAIAAWAPVFGLTFERS